MVAAPGANCLNVDKDVAMRIKAPKVGRTKIDVHPFLDVVFSKTEKVFIKLVFTTVILKQLIGNSMTIRIQCFRNENFSEI